MKIAKFRLQNFRGYEDETFDFSEDGESYGVWRIVARGTGNNVGKTVLLDAMRIHCTNIADNQYKKCLRKGSKKKTFITEMWDFEGNYTKLSRGEEDYYEWIINGEKGRADRTRGKVPEELVKYFNLYIEKEKTKQNLNFRNNDMPRLFSRTSEADNYMLLQKALGTEEFMLASRKTKKLRSSKNDELKIVQKQLSDERAKLSQCEESYKEVDKELLSISGIQNNLKKVSSYVTDVEEVLCMVDKIAKEEKYIDELSKGLANIDVESIESDIELHLEIEDLLSLLSELTDTEKYLENNKEVLQLSNYFEDTEYLGKLDVLFEVMETIQNYEHYRRYMGQNRTSEVIQGLKDAEEISLKIAKLHEVNNSYEQALEYSKFAKLRKKLLADISVVGDSIEELQNSVEICPFCDRLMEDCEDN